MTSASEETGPPSAPEEEIHPGERLRKAREARGFKRAEVAANLRLRVDMVQAMEEGQWDRLPGKTFALGYLRSYCNFLDLSPGPLLTQVLEEWQPESPVPLPQADSKPIKSGPWRVSRVILLLGILLALLIAIAWQGNLSFFLADLSNNDATNQEPGSNMETQAGRSGAGEMPKLTREQSSKQIPLLQGAEPEPPFAEKFLKKDWLETEPPIAAVFVPEENLPAEVKKTPTPSRVPVPEQMAPPQDKLSLSLSGDSWVEVSDSTGKQLVYKLLESGTVVELLGEAPFHVIVGNALAAEVKFNGRSLDLTPYTQGNVARLTVNSLDNENEN